METKPKHQKKNRNASFSKKLLIFMIVMAVLLSAACAINAFTSDGSYSSSTTALVTLTVEWIGGLIWCIKWYYKKEGTANNNKYAQAWCEKMVKDPEVSAEKIESVARIIEVITHDNDI